MSTSSNLQDLADLLLSCSVGVCSCWAVEGSSSSTLVKRRSLLAFPNRRVAASHFRTRCLWLSSLTSASLAPPLLLQWHIPRREPEGRRRVPIFWPWTLPMIAEVHPHPACVHRVFAVQQRPECSHLSTGTLVPAAQDAGDGWMGWLCGVAQLPRRGRHLVGHVGRLARLQRFRSTCIVRHCLDGRARQPIRIVTFFVHLTKFGTGTTKNESNKIGQPRRIESVVPARASINGNCNCHSKRL